MAVQTTDRKVTKRGALGGLSHGPVDANVLLPHGRPVFINAANGHITNTSNAGANKFAGFAHTRVDNTGGAAGDKNVEFHIRDRFEYECDAITQGDLGKKLYAVDNEELTLTAAGASLVGRLSEFITGTKGEVDIDTLA